MNLITAGVFRTFYNFLECFRMFENLLVRYRNIDSSTNAKRKGVFTELLTYIKTAKFMFGDITTASIAD